jgi:putative transposase
VIRFIDGHKDRRSGRLRWGIEPIARTLGIAPSTYHAAKTRPPSARAVRDAELMPVIARVHEENFAAYGADKMWDHLNNTEGIRVARCTVERLMRQMGVSGVRRGRSWAKTTISGDGTERPADLVDRDFTASAPNRLWLADLTYVKTHSGWVYVAFIIDAFSRMVVGWQASRSLRSDLAIDALEMAVFNRRGADADLSGLIHHSDRGVQYLSIRYSQRLDHNGVVASVGSKGDSYDNSMIESFNGLYKWELIYPHGPWQGIEDVEFATLEYVDWFNQRRRHGEILPGRRQYTTPTAHETTYYRQNVPAERAGTQTNQPL